MAKQPRKAVTPKELEEVARLGSSDQEIADYYGLSLPKLSPRCYKAMARGRAKARIALRGMQWDAAKDKKAGPAARACLTRMLFPPAARAAQGVGKTRGLGSGEGGAREMSTRKILVQLGKDEKARPALLALAERESEIKVESRKSKGRSRK